jgi:hypothetical protein
MKTLTVRQIDLKEGCKHVRLHTFPFPDVRDKGFYRTVTSYSAFFEGVKRRNRSDRYLFSVLDLRDGDFRGEYELKRDAALPVTEHASLLDFFKGIGYDRGSKKFLHNSNYSYDLRA